MNLSVVHSNSEDRNRLKQALESSDKDRIDAEVVKGCIGGQCKDGK